MKPIRCNKLVRDKMPEVIAADGWEAITTTLTASEALLATGAKLVEEASEYLSAVAVGAEKAAIEELADVVEVVAALANLHGASLDDLVKLAREKQAKRGGFLKGVWLTEIVGPKPEG